MTTTSGPSGFPAIDELLRGGIPAGQLICFAAYPSSLDDGPKSNISLHVIQQAITQGVPVLYVNTESTIDDTHLQHLGLDNK